VEERDGTLGRDDFAGDVWVALCNCSRSEITLIRSRNLEIGDGDGEGPKFGQVTLSWYRGHDLTEF
jgi:hypothetical protein